ncbi:hypothetical protein [Desulfovibrio sp. TomC]|uniref:hypothetical protein n=1 Tax=Desulfovibrio sp. TomC TaxID=1562888 RepID=UPI0012E209BE|nr:hypothetical protein [Desulfovibrio sp. TomC]
MKKFLAIVGGLFLALLLITAIFFGYAAYNGSKLDASSKIYIEENIPTILSTWSKDTILKLASPQLIETIENNQTNIDLLLTKSATLGKFQKISDIKGDSNTSFTTQNGSVITSRYAVQAKFDNGEATITVTLIQLSGQWRLLGLFINSPSILQ